MAPFAFGNKIKNDIFHYSFLSLLTHHGPSLSTNHHSEESVDMIFFASIVAISVLRRNTALVSHSLARALPISTCSLRKRIISRLSASFANNDSRLSLISYSSRIFLISSPNGNGAVRSLIAFFSSVLAYF